MAASQLQGLFSTVVYEYSPNPSQLQGLFSTVVYEYSPNPSQLQGLFSTVVYEYSPNPSQLQGLFSTTVYDADPNISDIAGQTAATASFVAAVGGLDRSVWTWTSVPGGSSIANSQIAFPDNKATTPINMSGNVALWHFSDETDSSGEGNDLTLANSPSFVTGKIGNALELDGSNQTAHVTDASLQLTGDMSLFTWVYLDTLGANESLFWCGASGESEAENILYLIRLNGTGGNADYYHEYGNGANQNVVITGLVTAGQWCHIGFVRDTTAKTVKFYRDGSPLQTYSYTHNPTGGGSSPLYLGSNNGTSNYMDGKFDEFAIWSRKLSDLEANNIYLAQSGSVAGIGNPFNFVPDVAGTYTVKFETGLASGSANAVISAASSGNSDGRTIRRKRRTQGARGRGFSGRDMIRTTGGRVVINGFEEI